MNSAAGKTAFNISDQVGHKTGTTDTETKKRLEISQVRGLRN